MQQATEQATNSTEPVVNIAVYKFVTLDNLKRRRKQLRSLCRSLELRGTILLTPEGINLFIAGSRKGIDQLLAELRSDPALADLEVKESLSDDQPFRRMLVKIKQEIIAFGVEGIDPRECTSPKLPAKTLRQWLDEGKPVTLLDVRNDYEIKVGTFQNAVPIGVDHFRHFPDAVRQLPTDWKDQPVVMFCTGGIRCEKAGPLMEREGFRQIYQLDGGILKYFEECGGDHYDGECFVFDQRVALNSRLEETETTQCFACQIPLTVEEQQSPKYVPGVSCPHCYQTPEESAAQTIAQRKATLQQVSSPLPGSEPYTNYRPLNVPQRCDGMTVLEILSTLHSHVSREEWEAILERGEILRHGQPITASMPLRAGERIERALPATVEPDVNPDIQFLYEDDALVVIHKPAPLPMHPGGRFNRNTVKYLLEQTYHPLKLRAAHRLDANTTGVVILTKSRPLAFRVQSQFEQGEVQKNYLAKVIGHPQEDEFVCDAPISESSGQAGSRSIDSAGLPSRTEFTVQKRLDDGTTLLSVRPITGRTNQIRLHLWHLGFPICGDPVYLPEGQIGERQTLSVDDPPLCLHAYQIAFTHPLTHERVQFSAPAPEWTQE